MPSPRWAGETASAQCSIGTNVAAGSTSPMSRSRSELERGGWCGPASPPRLVRLEKNERWRSADQLMNDDPVVNVVQQLLIDFHESRVVVDRKLQGQVLQMGQQLDELLSRSNKQKDDLGVMIGDLSGKIIQGVCRDFIAAGSADAWPAQQAHAAPVKIGDSKDVFSIAEDTCAGTTLDLLDGNGAGGGQNDEGAVRPVLSGFEAGAPAVNKTPSNGAGFQIQEQLRTSVGARKSVSYVDPTASLLERIVTHTRFDIFIACIVVFNCFLVGAQTNYEATNRGSSFEAYEILEYFCTAIYTVEFFLRIGVLRSRLLDKHERLWFLLDVVLVLMSWAEIVVALLGGAEAGSSGASTAKVLKVARMARIMRIIRVVRFLHKIRVMMIMIGGSMVSLFWLFVLLLGVIYIFAVCLTRGATEYLFARGDEKPSDWQKVWDQFGTVATSMYTLFGAMTGGIDWADPAESVKATGRGYFFLFFFFVFFTFFSVLNIVTGVFVDSAIQKANNDRMFTEMKAQKRKRALGGELRELLTEIDQDRSGHITWEEWSRALHSAHVIGVMEGMDISIFEAEEVFMMLDDDGDGCVSVVEFVEGMRMLKGAARSLDMQRIIKRIDVIGRALERGGFGAVTVSNANSNCITPCTTPFMARPVS